MEPRYRRRVTSRTASGTATRVSGGRVVLFVQQNTKADTDSSSTIDFLGKKVDHPFFLERESKNYSNIFYRTNPGALSPYVEYKNYDIHISRSNPAHIPLGLPSESSSMTTAMARTNPGRSEISIPTFVAELKDFPSLVRQGGRLALGLKKKGNRLRRRKKLKEAADAYLAYRFAINPLISDVKKLMNFQASVQNRMNELDRLYSKGGLRRRVEIWSSSGSTEQKNFAMESQLGAVVRCDINTETSYRRWCTLRWTPIGRSSYTNDQEKQDLAHRLVGGFTASGLVETAWELVPWSWMIDWFTNTQSFIQANNGSVPAFAGGRCTMTHSYTTTSFRRSDTISALTGGDGFYTRESKTRVIGGGGTLEASLPFLNGSQLSILGALSVSKLSR